MPEKQVKKQPKAGRGIINDKMKKAQFKKGQSGNVSGRPKKGSAIADILNAIGDEKYKNKTKREELMNVVYEEALGGSLPHIQFVVDRTEGKALERIKIKDLRDEVIIE